MLIVGVSGVTNGGKTTLAKALRRALPNSHLICQDSYFLPRDSKKHIWIPELNHINWEIMSSLDMDKMWKDITDVLKEGKFPLKSGGNGDFVNTNTENICSIRSDDAICNGSYYEHEIGVLIIEGFLILNYQPIADLCHLRYHLTLDKDECWKRRNSRVYDPPDVLGFFEKCVWPEYLKHKEEMISKVKDVKVIDGTKDIRGIFREMFGEIVIELEKIKEEKKEEFRDIENL